MKGGEKLGKAASQLFYQNGYTNTGIRELCEASGVGRSTMYHFYESKEAVGKDYLTRQVRANIALMKRLTRKSKSPLELFRNWRLHLKDMYTDNRYYGCPLANLGAQVQWSNTVFQPELRNGFQYIEQVIADYYIQLKSHGGLIETAKPEQLARLTLSIYEGAVVLFKSTGDVRYLEDLEDSLVAAIRGYMTQGE